jgi:murein DD-endopeptidase MepM/ murein hydrolase activator NlpD
VISGFGDSYDGEGKYRTEGAHVGVDVWGNPGDYVLAAADGRVEVVTEAEKQSPNDVTCGKYIVIRHESDLVLDSGLRFTASTKYCHLKEYSVTADSMVKRGQQIGTIGTTGWRRAPANTTGFEHVHWELRTFQQLDPLPFTVGCFDPKQAYPTDRLVLTYPVRCKN